MAETPTPLELFRLDGQTALVTGASSGLGARFTRVLAAAGAEVIVTARRADRLQELADEVPGVRAEPCDLSNDAAAAGLIERCGRIDILVNNAGASDGGIAAEGEEMDEYDRIIAINQRAVFHLTTRIARGMIERRHGSVVNIASVHGLVAAAPNNQAAYVASKSALVGLTRELAVQWAKHGVRVNAIAPAYFESELTADMFADDKSRAWIERNTPMRRPGRSEELDGALLFLASSAGSYVTGITLAVDGGWTAR